MTSKNKGSRRLKSGTGRTSKAPLSRGAAEFAAQWRRGDPAPAPALTPVERRDRYWLKRDDLYETAGVYGGKVRTCAHLARGARGLVTAGSRASPQCNIVAHVAAALGVPCRVHTPAGTLGPELEAAAEAGAEVVQHRAGYNSVIIARAREDAHARGWVEIPFGMECREAVEQTRAQCANIPAGVKRIVVPVGSGMSLAGILHGLRDTGCTVPVLGVCAGADPRKRLARYAPPGWSRTCTLVNAGVDYHTEVSASIEGVILDPVYEAKCVPFLKPDDLFWIVGIHQTNMGVRWKFSAKSLATPHDCTLRGIQARCGGACCHGPYWPGRTGPGGTTGPCALLGPAGCTLGPETRPVTCLMYPLRMNKNGTWVKHHRANFSKGICKGNHGRGPALVDALAVHLTALFGAAEYKRIRENTRAGRDTTVRVPPAIAAAYAQEGVWEEQDKRPEPRTAV